jgi:hypothetical protein
MSHRRCIFSTPQDKRHKANGKITCSKRVKLQQPQNTFLTARRPASIRQALIGTSSLSELPYPLAPFAPDFHLVMDERVHRHRRKTLHS